jgi:glycosyltransferase involved in cell wall biosynthesis
MPLLYQAATHYISASFGEGWDLPMTEAAACGLRLIAPDHSAYRTYLDETVATMIPARPVPALPYWNEPFGELFRWGDWWEPDEDALMESIRSAIDGRESARLPARDRISAQFTWADAGRRLIEILTELEPLAEKRSYVQAVLGSKLAPDEKHAPPDDRKDPDRA